MAKREIPLFIVDTSRNHKRGECDFLVCTDKDNGFLAKVDYVDGEKEEVGDDYRIGCPRNGVSLRIQIYQMIGTHPNVGNIRTLLKKGKGTYSGSLKLNFKIQLRKPVLKSVKKSGSTDVKLTWKKLSVQQDTRYTGLQETAGRKLHL